MRHVQNKMMSASIISLYSLILCVFFLCYLGARPKRSVYVTYAPARLLVMGIWLYPSKSKTTKFFFLLNKTMLWRRLRLGRCYIDEICRKPNGPSTQKHTRNMIF